MNTQQNAAPLPPRPWISRDGYGDSARVAELTAALRNLIKAADLSGVTAHFADRGFGESIEDARRTLGKLTARAPRT